VSTVGTLA
jgi:hypothetical protein